MHISRKMVPRENINDRYKGDLYCSVVYSYRRRVIEANTESELEARINEDKKIGFAPGHKRLQVEASYEQINEMAIEKLKYLIDQQKKGRKIKWKQVLK